MSSSPSEFQIIAEYFEDVGEHDAQVIAVGIGDDCAVVNPPPGKSLCFSIDTMVEGRHFPKSAPPYELAMRAMAASISDLAAMGATPSFFTLSLSIERADRDWLQGFSAGLKFMADTYQLSLVGGDTTRGACAVAIQVHGFAEPGQIMRRSGAKAGELVIVTGSLGDAGAALALLDREVESELEHHLLGRYYRPSPRVAEGQLISRYASACIDVSDGLVADARHIADASRCLLTIDASLVPISPQLRSFDGENALSLALNAGDDYELLFTVSAEGWDKIRSEAGDDMCFTQIGLVESQQLASGGRSGVRVMLEGREIPLGKEGYKHFE